MDHQVRNVEITDIEDLIKINELSVPAVNSISKAQFEWFHQNSIYFKLIESINNEVQGFLLALNSRQHYLYVNHF